ncbi:MAG: hypothetical protein HQL13_06700 [Candidatus Omnitrophica bacterium]|nr:hypothetical protein [Candidatus Omnitrophota bacterium]
MIVRLFLCFTSLMLLTAHPATAEDDFRKNNPDIKKYEFVRSYITALGYMEDIYDRWNKNEPRAHFAHQNDKLIKASINDLALDNSDLRIIKNYLLKYLTSPNILMRKIADIVVRTVSLDIAVNDDEKALWDKWYALYIAGQVTKQKEDKFVHEQYAMELRRKEADKGFIQASVLLTKLLVSDKNKDAKGHLLAITAQERQKLLEKLDSFSTDNLAWGLKAGQRTLEGSIAVIREILEDSIWISINEK